MASRPTPLPPRTLDEVAEAFPAYRQSILSTMDNCSLSTLFDLEGRGYTNAAQARGIIFHRFAAEYLRTLARTGEITMESEEAMQILYEVSRQSDMASEDVVFVPARERRLLRIAALALSNVPLRMSNLIEVETRLETVVTYTKADGATVYRKISGTPDALLADPPNGAIVLDWKTAPSAPAAQAKDENGTPKQSHWTGDHEHVSWEGYFQQRVYALLVMKTYPSVEQVTLREYYVLKKESRNATVPREALEHIEHELSLLVQLLDRGVEEGSASGIWQPSPGRHCGYCRRPTSCPIEAEARMVEGGITSQAQAERVAAEMAFVDSLRDKGMPALKAWHENSGLPVSVKDAKGRHEWRWGKDSGGKRRFKLHTPEKSDRGPEDPALKEAFEQAAERGSVSVDG